MSNTFSGILLLIIGPSGVGKGTVISMLRKQHPDWQFAISATTRPPRPGEQDGETYHFLSTEAFEEKKAKEEFLEWAVVHKDYQYGTLQSEILPYLAAGKTVLREVDIQGFLSIREKIPTENVLSFFFLPPPEEILRKRILERAPISEEVLDKRMESLKKEVEGAVLCDIEVQTQDGVLDYPMGVIQSALEEKKKKLKQVCNPPLIRGARGV